MSKETSLLGRPAPPFSIKAIASGRSFRLGEHLGKPVLLLFANHVTGRGAQEIVEHVRRHYSRFAQLPIALIIDARIVPRLLRGVAQGQMEKEYREAAAQVPSGFDPADHLILLPDWGGEIVRAYHVTNLGQAIAVVLVGPDGSVVAQYQGADPAPTALTMVREVLGEAS